MDRLRSLGDGLVRQFFPFRCCQCGLWGASGLCASCWSGFGICPVPLFPDGSVYAMGAGPYRDGLRRAVLQLKYKGATELSHALGQTLAARLERHQPGWLYDSPLLVPIPASPSRSRHRGHRPVEQLSEAISIATGLPLALDVLTLVGDPAPRKALTAEQRDEDETLIYRARGPRMRPGRAILVDDVLTSGGTLRRACLALQDRGWKAVGALVLAAAA